MPLRPTDRTSLSGSRQTSSEAARNAAVLLAPAQLNAALNAVKGAAVNGDSATIRKHVGAVYEAFMVDGSVMKSQVFVDLKTFVQQSLAATFASPYELDRSDKEGILALLKGISTQIRLRSQALDKVLSRDSAPTSHPEKPAPRGCLLACFGKQPSASPQPERPRGASGPRPSAAPAHAASRPTGSPPPSSRPQGSARTEAQSSSSATLRHDPQLTRTLKEAARKEKRNAATLNKLDRAMEKLTQEQAAVDSRLAGVGADHDAAEREYAALTAQLRQA